MISFSLTRSDRQEKKRKRKGKGTYLGKLNDNERMIIGSV